MLMSNPPLDRRSAGQSTLPTPGTTTSQSCSPCRGALQLPARRLRHYHPQRRLHHDPAGHPAHGRSAGRTRRAPAAPGHDRRWGQAQSQHPGPAERHGSDPDRYRRRAPIPALGRQGWPTISRPPRSTRARSPRSSSRMPIPITSGPRWTRTAGCASRTPPTTSGRPSGISGPIRTSSPPCLQHCTTSHEAPSATSAPSATVP